MTSSKHYKKAKAEFEKAFGDYAKLLLKHFGIVHDQPELHYFDKLAAKGLPQPQTTYYLKESKRINKRFAETPFAVVRQYPSGLYKPKKPREKSTALKGDRYELAKNLSELEPGEILFVKKSEWVSAKSPSEKLRRILQKSKKDFKLKRKTDGSGWDFTRVK